MNPRSKYDRRVEHRADEHFAEVILAYRERKNKFRKEYFSIYRSYYVFKVLQALTAFGAADRFAKKLIHKCLKNQVYQPLFEIYQFKGFLDSTRNRVVGAKEHYDLADKYLEYFILDYYLIYYF